MLPQAQLTAIESLPLSLGYGNENGEKSSYFCLLESCPSTLYQNHFFSMISSIISSNVFEHLKSCYMELTSSEFYFLLYKNLYGKNIQIAQQYA